MAPYQLLVPVFIIVTLVASDAPFASCQVLKGSVTCMDCDQNYDLSGIKVLVKCNKLEESATTITEENGSFETNLPLETPKQYSPISNNCRAQIHGGPHQLFVSRKDMDMGEVVKAKEDDSYTISKPLRFYTKCPMKYGKCGDANKNSGLGSSKTVDFPFPNDWGLAPTSYYLPIVPIIGIP